MSDELTSLIIESAIEVHRHLGPGLLESIYEEAICHEFDLRKIAYERQKPIDVIYKEKVIKGQRLDLIIKQEVILDLKSVSKLPEVALAQMLSYLRATQIKRGLIINFGETLLKKGIKRVSL